MYKLNYAKINKQNALDYAMRDYECRKEYIESGYIIEGKEPYWNYISNYYWEKFISSISPIHLSQYNDGDGGELYKKKGRYGYYPPKMASFGSSSRFIYNISKDIAGFTFEKKLPTKVGHNANLDGYLQCNNLDIFVEAKCREIYSSHKKIKVSNVYRDVYKQLHERYTKFSFEDFGSYDEMYFNCTFKLENKPIVYFDIKQLICHFLGISANILENKNVNSNIKFIYLIFNPNHNTCFSNELISSYKSPIINIYNETIKEINYFNGMKELFDAIMEIQSNRLGISKKDFSFEFHIADQNVYVDMITS